MPLVPLAWIDSPDELDMVPPGQQIRCYAGPDECSSKPQRQPVRLYCGSMLRNLKLLQKEPEASYHEAESH
jgi:hypothetical protein